ncbi:PIR Superfamily Protein [Plasmodium ovale curtisi]|uniref:PIR Superfamily Protein n=1 Tax=Plasmodium ovale curtisi TaxID=864141 RepID=A0A1A8VW74_PLAOA|nr:PIR Superfamily Protein [Plasmodium ovale curtisi]
MDFSELAEVLIDLKKSPSYEIYDKFNRIVSDEKYKSYCHTIPDSANYKEVKELCYKFVRNVKEIDDMENHEYRKKCCDNSIYWTYNEIRKIFNSRSNKINQSDVTSKFYNIGKRIDGEKNKYICSHYFVSEDFNKRRVEKDFHDYFKNYDIIKNIVPHNEEECKNFQGYLQHLTSQYDNEDCCTYGDCDDYFSCNPDYEPRVLLNKLNNCNSIFPNKHSEQGVESKPVENLSVFQSSQLQDRNLPSGKDITEVQDTKHIGQPPFFVKIVSETDVKPENDRCKIMKGQMGEYHPNSAPCYEGTTPIENYRESLEVQSQEDLAVSESQCNNLICNPRRIINAAVVVFGIFCLLFFCYRMTPFGLWLRKRILKKRKRKKYFYKKYEYEFPDNEQEYLYINSYTRRMNLAYYPA